MVKKLPIQNIKNRPKLGRKGAYKDQNHPSVPPATPGVASKPSSSKPSSHDSNLGFPLFQTVFV